MTKFIMGFLLGAILGIGGTSAFLISAHGGDYLMAASPRVRELEASLKQADQEREWLRGQLRDSGEVVTKLESRFVALATRFEDLTSHAATLLGAPPKPDEKAQHASAATAATRKAKPPADSSAVRSTPAPEPTASPSPTGTPKEDTAAPTPAGGPSKNETGEHDANAGSPDL